MHRMTIYKYILYLFITIAISCSGERKNQENKDTAKTLTPESTKKEETKHIIFFGNSLTAGYGVENSQAFPALIQEIIDSLGLNYKVINAGLSGETTSGGRDRVNWVLRQKADIFVLELGGNDGLRGISPEVTRSNLQFIIEAVRAENQHTKIILAGMQVPPNMGQRYTSQFNSIFTDITEKNKVRLIPFLLEGVGGEPDLNIPDGIHPNEEGHKIVTRNVWSVLKEVL